MNKTFKRVLTLALSVLCVCAVMIPGVVASAEETTGPVMNFTDVPTTSKYYDAVSYCYKYGFIKGKSATSFGPGDALTREQIALIWARTLHVKPPHTFTDVPQSAKTEGDQAIIITHGLGIFAGVSPTEFGRNTSVTREQAITVLARTYLPGDVGESANTLKRYEDAASISSWAKDSVAECIKLGLLTGAFDGAKLYPQSPITRAELCQLIYNVMREPEPEPSPEPEKTFTVTYDANGGTGGKSDKGLKDGAEYTVKAQSATDITREGFTFDGWNTAGDGKGKDYEAGDTFKVTADVKLYAQWTKVEPSPEPEKTFTVTYDANGGTGAKSDKDIKDGTEYTVLSDTDAGITREQYAFEGWNTSADGKGTGYKAGDKFKVTADVTLFAQWKAVAQG